MTPRIPEGPGGSRGQEADQQRPFPRLHLRTHTLPRLSGHKGKLPLGPMGEALTLGISGPRRPSVRSALHPPAFRNKMEGQAPEAAPRGQEWRPLVPLEEGESPPFLWRACTVSPRGWLWWEQGGQAWHWAEKHWGSSP